MNATYEISNEHDEHEEEDEGSYYMPDSNNDGESNEEVLSNDGGNTFNEDVSSNSPSEELLIDAADGFTFNLPNCSKNNQLAKASPSLEADRPSLNINCNTISSAFKAQQNFNSSSSSSSSSLYDFSSEEIRKMKEKVQFELNRDRRQKEGDCMKSPFIQNQLKSISFFPDPELNRMMSKLLRKLQYVKEAIRVTMYIFFDIEKFKEYYVPSPSGPSGISSNKPFPKYERFHAFWLSIHCNESSFCAKYTKGLIDANSNFRKLALNNLEYTGYVSHRTNCYISESSRAKSNVTPDQNKNNLRNLKGKLRSQDDVLSSKRFKLSLPSSSSSKSQCSTSERRVDIIYDANGFAYINSVTGGKRWYVRDPSRPPLTSNEFYTSSRLLLMKGRALYLWNHLRDKLLESQEVPWFSGSSDVLYRLQNLNHFPDHDLNQLVKQLINHNITLVKVIKITVSVFFSSAELSKAAVPLSSTFQRVLRPPVPGYELFHEFWNYLYDIQNSRERRRRFEGSFGEVNRVYSTDGQAIPELPF